MPFFLRPILPIWGILACLAVLLALSYWQRRAHRPIPELPRRIRRVLLMLRLLPLLLFFTWILQPTWRKNSPLPGATQIAVLADCSASMTDTQDCRGNDGTPATRWQHLCQLLRESLQTPPHASPVTLYRFSGEPSALARWNLSESADGDTALPGDTDIGSALTEAFAAAQRPGVLPWRSALLLSDGRDWGQQSQSAAKALAAAGIPVSTLCLGSARQQAAIALSFAPETPSALPLHTPASATLLLASTGLSSDTSATIVLRDETGNAIATQELRLSSATPSRCELPLPPSDLPGEKLFHAEAVVACEGNTTATASHILEYLRPQQRRILYLSATHSWEWRFLRNALQESRELQLGALIRLGLPAEENSRLSADWKPNRRLFPFGLRKPLSEEDDFPTESEFYADYDVIALPCESADRLDPSQRSALRAFVEEQGGGLLWIGDATSVPDDLKTLLPGNTFEPRRATSGTKLLASPGETVFGAPFPNAASLPTGSTYAICQQPGKLSQGVLKDNRGGALLLIEGNYGAGRVAWSGLSESWRWAFGRDAELHATYWQRLLGWLAENRKPPLETDLPPDGLRAGMPTEVGIRVLAPDYRPASSASGLLVVQSQDGAEQRYALMPDPTEPGRLIAECIPPMGVDAVRLRFEVQSLPGTPKQILEKYALVRKGGMESSNTAADPKTLHDIAAITHGRELPVNTTEIPWEKLPSSQKIPLATTESPLCPPWAVLPAVAILLLAEYTVRRKYALK